MSRSRAGFVSIASTLTVIVLGVAGCSTTDEGTADPSADNSPRQLSVEVIEVYDHDGGAFTQGLEIDGDRLYESTGRVGESWVRSTQFDGVPVSGPEIARAELAPPLFGEGITVIDDVLWQLTWKNGVAIARDKDTLTEQGRFPLTTEGWGICALENRLVTSDGTSTLMFRDPDTFAVTDSVEVTRGGQPVGDLNELECADDGTIYANVWQTDTIVAVDPADGHVSSVIDASLLRSRLDTDGAANSVDVLNGIAQIPGTDRFLLTGKYWPQIFEVRFVE
ncbi:glutaminyl-peptide cyclotransferase [Rhodococcus sp. KBS0724]|uniref:glutaminyl-peptide cyclotransferase n=1 Tax=Rhodococcus sp. KBS0724 TaxID=1179674 RepID=UPI00110E5DE6|nr:glutaminyl-peptide cyclotransferase [Rhodococcus sp. KBS0724]TSD45791.1 glutaminyl-peptide cyclotransferase [Rhodococcus sp. KBS0724]